MKKCLALSGESGFFNSAGKLGLCCNDFVSDHKNSREDSQILDYNLRKNFLKEKNYSWDDFKFCDFCKQNEEQGFKSTRQILDNKKRFELTLSVGNVCNLRCVMCRPDLSYLLSQDISVLPSDIADTYPVIKAEKINLTESNKHNIEKFLSSLDVPVEINLLGGEPLIDESMVDWFVYLLNTFSNIEEMQITTNLTYNSKKTLKLCENSKVTISASIEGFEESYEWTRFGSKWDNVQKNIINFKNLLDHRIQVHSTIHAISIIGNEKLVNFLNEYNIKQSKALLFSPEFLQLKILKDNERSILTLDNIDSYDPFLRNQFEQYMLSIEKSRKKNMPESISTFFGINRDN